MNTPERKTELKVYAIVNPVAGSADPDALEKVLTESLGSSLLCFHRTRKDEDFPALVREAKQLGATVILTAGGDGTVSQVATELVGGALQLYVFPAGTANLLAKCLGMPFDAEEAVKVLKEGHTTHLDAIRVHDTHFFSHLSVGVYSNIAKQTPSSAKRLFGRLAYIWSGLKILMGEKNWRFYLTLDGQPLKMRASTIMVANVGDIGAGKLQWGPNISPSDSRLDVSVIRSKTWQHYATLIWEFFRYKDKAPSQAKHLQLKETLHIEANRPLPVRGDGETIGTTPVTLRLVPAALEFVVPGNAQ